MSHCFKKHCIYTIQRLDVAKVSVVKPNLDKYNLQNKKNTMEILLSGKFREPFYHSL